jgi:O-antigen/teichoic acid export membrane protein
MDWRRQGNAESVGLNYLILLDHLVVSGSRFLLSILIARALGLEDFGVYALLWTIVTFASAMQIPVTITPMMQLGPRVLGHRQEEFFATAMFAQLAYSVVAVPFITVAAAVIVWGRPDALAIILAINI